MLFQTAAHTVWSKITLAGMTRQSWEGMSSWKETEEVCVSNKREWKT